MIGRELSSFLNVSDRTIRSDIECINRYYNNTLIESSVRKGYHLSDNISAHLNISSENVIPQTSFQRCIYIIKKLLFEKKEINLVDLMNKIFVSDFSIENDLRQIKGMIKSYPTLKLVRHKEYIHLEGNEQNKRIFYKDILIKEMKGNFLNLDRLAYLFTDFDLLFVKDMLEETFEKYSYRIREIEIPVLMIDIGITVERIASNNYMQKSQRDETIKSCIEYTIAHEFYKKVSKSLNIILIEDEIILFALMLRGEKRMNDTDNIINFNNSDYNVNQLLSDILQDIYLQFDVDFREDEDLKAGLSTHIQLLLERINKNIDISNVYLDEIKRKYPLLFEIAIRVSEFMQIKLKININENDISFIAQHLGGAFERKENKNKYRVIIINPNSQALSSLCVKKVESAFHERINIVECTNYFEMKKVLKAKPDMILTTLHLEHNLNILTVQISIFINGEDESKIFQALNLLDSNGFKEEFALNIKVMMESRFFYMHLDLGTPKEVISFMSNELYQEGLVERDFEDAVLKRENLSPTSFVYSFAVPHPLKAQSNKSKIAIALLKKPIQWGDFQVKLVLLLAVREDEQKILCTFFDWLSSMVNNSSQLSALMNVSNYDEFIKHIIE